MPVHTHRTEGVTKSEGREGATRSGAGVGSESGAGMEMGTGSGAGTGTGVEVNDAV